MTPGDVVADRFELLRLAGSGAMGAVYQALDRSTGEKVAIKLALKPTKSGRERFIRESQVLSEVRHPAIVAHVDHGRTAAGAFYLVMEWLEGPTLAHRLEERGLTLRESVVLIRRLAEGLGAAHAMGVVHRDVKPANVMLPRGELAQAKLLDFGVARRNDASSRLTLEGMPIGTPQYMSPEQARGERDVGPRADVFALGSVLYECLTGKPPFAGESLLAILGEILLADAVPVERVNAAVPRELASVVGRMLAKEPEDRPADGNAVVAQLDLGEMPDVRAPAAPRAGPALTSSERRLVSIVLIGPEELWTAADSGTVSTDDAGGTLVDIPPDVLREATRGGARLERLIDGSLLLAFAGEGDAASRAWSASVAALKLATDGRRVVLTTGRSESGKPIGESLERGARLLALPVVTGGARVDEVSVALLSDRARFDSDDHGPILAADAPRVMGRRSPFVGRRRELALLDAQRDECLEQGGARATLVLGPAGSGKSRLRGELVRRAVDDMDVWSASANTVGAGGALRLVAQLVSSAARIREGDPDAERRAAIEALIGPPSSELLCHLVGVRVGSPGPQLKAALDDPKLMGAQLRRAFVQLVATAARRDPLLLLIEDLHWGDTASVSCLDEALRVAGEAPLWVVGFARPEATELLGDIWSNRRLEQIRLGPLGPRSARRLVEAALPTEQRDPEVIAKILERAAGNPLYIEELVRAVASGSADELPASVLALVEARLEALDPAARRVLRAASVFGSRFWPDGVEALLGETGGLSEWVDVLIAEELVEPVEVGQFADHAELRFHHDIVRETAYTMLTESDRELGHQLAAEWLERAGEREPLVLAEHFEKGGMNERAAVAFARAARQALEANALERTKGLARRGLAFDPVMEHRAELWLLEAMAHRWLGEYAEAGPLFEKALARLPESSDAWYSAAIGVAYLGQVAGTGAAVIRVAALIEGADLERGRGLETQLRVATMLMATGHYEAGSSTVRRVEAAARRRAADEPALAARLYRALEWIAIIEGDPVASLRALEGACAALERAGDLPGACGERINIGCSLFELGLYARAEDQLLRALAEARHHFIPPLIAGAYHNLGIVVAHRDRLEEARVLEARAVAEYAVIGHVRLEGASRIYLAEILRRLGELDRAETEAKRAMKLVRTVPPMLPGAQAALASVLIDAGRVDEALTVSEAAAATLADLGALETGEAIVRAAHVRALRAAGHTQRADAAAAAARGWLNERASKIGDEEIRQAYLAIPEHRAILESGDGDD